MTLPEQVRKPGTVVALIAGLIGGILPVVRAGDWLWGVLIWLGLTGVLYGVSVAVESVPWHRPVRAPAPAPPVPTPPPAPLPAAPAVENRPGNDVAVVFVHGLFSDANTWSHFHKLITADPELDPVGLCYFRYATPFASPAPTRRIPDLDIIGRQLGTYFENDLGDLPNVVLVTHSQGGLVAQFFIEQMLNNGRGLDLARIKQLIMFACPNGGSELFLTMRRFLSKHPQERDLRPLNKRINEAHEVLLNKVIHAKEITEHTCPIPIAAYAGAEDNVVVPASALTVLPHQHTGVLPGGHSSIIQPTSPADSAYVTLRKKVRSVLDAAGQRHQTTPGGQGE